MHTGAGSGLRGRGAPERPEATSKGTASLLGCAPLRQGTTHTGTCTRSCTQTHTGTRVHTHTELGALLRFQSPPSGRDGDRLVCRAATATGTAGRHQTPSPGQGTCGPRLTWAHALRAALAAPAPAGLAGCEQARAQSQCDPAIQRGATRGDPCTQKPLSWETPAPSPRPCERRAEARRSPGRWGRSGCRRRGTPPGSSPPHSPGRRRGWRPPSLKSRSETVRGAPSWRGLGELSPGDPKRSSHERGQGRGVTFSHQLQRKGLPNTPR